MKLDIVCALLLLGVVLSLLGVVHGEEDNGDTEPQQEHPDVDMYCVDAPPTLEGPCTEKQIWTFDYNKGQCVQIKGCFEEAGPEYNMFSSQLGCQRWCKT